MILLDLDDFKTEFSLAQSNASDATIQEYIDKYEPKYIKRILGVELGEKFITDVKGEDLDSDEIEARFQILIDGFDKQSSCSTIYENAGMKKILAALVFYHYVSDTQAKHSQSGVVTNQAEVSTVVTPENATRFGEQKWNEALASIEAVQWWCGTEDSANYSEYDGTYFRPRYSALL